MGWRKGYVPPNTRTKYCGVYCIRHLPTGRMYIGGSTDITGRYTHHRHQLRRGIHKTRLLQTLWLKDGELSFAFETLELCSPDVLLALEDDWIKRTPNHLNTVDMAVTGHANNYPSEIKKQAARDRWQNPEYRAKREAWLANRGPDGRLRKQQSE